MRELVRRVRGARINSRVVRGLLGLVYRPGRVYRLPFGPLRGARLRYDREINFHAMLGLWELDNVRFLQQTLLDTGAIRPDATVCDLGANIGMFSLWFARRCVPRGRVHAFEVAPVTLERLRDTLALNGVGNVSVVPAAGADRSGRTEFFIGRHHHSHSLDATWSGGGDPATTIVVDAVALDDYFDGSPARQLPAVVKIDIEGGGVRAIPGARRCLAQARPFVLIESHTPAEDAAISEAVVGNAYRAYRLDTRSWVTRPDRTHPDPDGIWGTLFLCPTDRLDALRGVLGTPPAVVATSGSSR